MLKKVWAWVVLGFVLAVPMGQAASDVISPQKPLPLFELSTPQDPAMLAYLGVDATKTKFSVGNIDADVVIIEIFSMYCPFCQLEAPKVNTLFNRIAEDKALAGRVKLIGIGVGNSDYEVDYFRKSYHIDFPLFSDGDFTIHKAFGEVRTPFFVGVKRDADGQAIVFFTHLGVFESVDGFLADIIKASGMKGGK